MCLPTIKRGNSDAGKPFLTLVMEELMTEKVYAPLRDREDFKALLELRQSDGKWKIAASSK